MPMLLSGQPALQVEDDILYDNPKQNGVLSGITQNNGGPGFGSFLSFAETYTHDNVNRLTGVFETPPGQTSAYWSRGYQYEMTRSATGG